jgi:hypothetical protein
MNYFIWGVLYNQLLNYRVLYSLKRNNSIICHYVYCMQYTTSYDNYKRWRAAEAKWSRGKQNSPPPRFHMCLLLYITDTDAYIWLENPVRYRQLLREWIRLDLLVS